MVMLLVAALASFVVLATRVAADGPSNHNPSHPNALSIAKYIDPQGNYCPVQSDRRRFTHLMNKVNSSNLAVEESGAELSLNNAGPCYEAKVGVGVPPTYYNLVVDSGSSNTWVGANAPYVKTKTSVDTSDLVHVKYGSAYFTGNLYNDTVTIASGVAASQQPIGVAFNTSGIYPRDGIMGIGPTDLTFGTMSYPRNTSTIPTVTDSLFAQGVIPQNFVAVSLEPTASGSVVNGELTFGVTDPTKYIGDINYSPISKNPVAGKYWGIDATIRYGGGNGGASVGLSGATAGIVDTGTTLVYLSTDAYNLYAKATGGVLDSSTRLLRITDAQYASLQSLYFDIGGTTFELTRNAQIWQRTHNGAIQGDNESIYLAVQDIGQAFPGIDFICGMAFLERFYSVFDSGNRRVGLAITPFTNATTN